MHYCTTPEKMECSITWYSRVATTQQNTCHTHIQFNMFNTRPHSLPHSFCLLPWDVTRHPCLPPSACRHAHDTAPPFLSHSGMRHDAAPASSSPLCALFFSFFFSFLFTLFPVTAPLLSQVHGDPSLPANTRGSEAAMTSQPPASPPQACSRHHRCYIPLI